MNINIRIIICIILCLFATPVFADIHYLATTGTDSGTCTSGAPCLTLQYAFTQLTGGDTLTIADGTYAQTGSAGNDNKVTDANKPPNGPGTGSGDARFTVIKATNEGQVTISGATPFLNITGSEPTYIKFEGILFTGSGSSGDNRYIMTVSSEFNSYWYFRRCGFYRTGTGGASTIWLNNDYLLFEECYFYGRGRYGLSFRPSSSYNIVRRCVARLDDATGGGYPIAGFMAYEGDYIEWQNSIVIDMDRDLWSDYSYCLGGFATHVQGDGDGTSYNFYRGCIVLNNDFGYKSGADYATAGFAFFGDQNTCTNLTWSNCIAWGNQGYGMSGGGVNNTVDNCTVGEIHDAESTVGDCFRGFSDTGDAITDSIAYSCRRYGLYSSSGNDYNCVNGNGTDYSGTSEGAHDVSSSPLTGGLTYLPRIEAASTLATAGSGGGQIGATVLYQYGTDGTFYGEDGYNTLTETSLWPFPYEDTMRTHMRAYSNGSADGTRGFCATGQSLSRYIWEYLGSACPEGMCTATTPPASSSGSAGFSMSGGRIY